MRGIYGGKEEVKVVLVLVCRSCFGEGEVRVKVGEEGGTWESSVSLTFF